MVKVFGPAFSLDASGTIGDAIVFSKWKGRNYIRERVIPANPQSGPQTGLRAMMKFLAQQWDGLSAANKATWLDRATALVVSNFNAFVSYNQTRFRNFLPPSKEDPATQTGTQSSITNEAASAGVRQITVSGDCGAGAEQWGVLIFRSTSASFSTAYSNLIAAIPCAASASFSFVDSPLAAGTYYYNFRAFSDDGVLGAEETEVNATVS